MRTGLEFKSAQFDHVRGEAEYWIKMRGINHYLISFDPVQGLN
jgi:hypothetical protein